MDKAAQSVALQIVYGFKSPAPQDDAFRQIHERILNQLAQVKACGLIHSFEVRQVPEAFEKQDEGKSFSVSFATSRCAARSKCASAAGNILTNGFHYNSCSFTKVATSPKHFPACWKAVTSRPRPFLNTFSPASLGLWAAGGKTATETMTAYCRLSDDLLRLSRTGSYFPWCGTSGIERIRW